MNIIAGALSGYTLHGVVKAGNKVKIDSPRGSSYEIEIGEDGKLTCTCPAHRYRGTCKHTDYVRSQLGNEGRMPRERVEEILIPVLQAMRPYVTKVETAGSYRRGRQSLKDVDILAIGDPDKVLLSLKGIRGSTEVIMAGENIIRMMVSGLQIDIRFTVAESWGATMRKSVV